MAGTGGRESPDDDCVLADWMLFVLDGCGPLTKEAVLASGSRGVSVGMICFLASFQEAAGIIPASRAWSRFLRSVTYLSRTFSCWRFFL